MRLPPTGVKVPVGEVSVMPQPSLRLQPVSSAKRCATSQRQRRAARAAVLQRAQVELLDARVVDQRGEHRRHTGEAGDLLVRQVAAARLRRRSARAARSRRRAAHAEQHVHRQRVDVEQRQHREHTLLAFLEHRGVDASPRPARRRNSGWRASASRPWAGRWCRRCTAARRWPRPGRRSGALRAGRRCRAVARSAGGARPAARRPRVCRPSSAPPPRRARRTSRRCCRRSASSAACGPACRPSAGTALPGPA